jgi:GNAT superfamily N-acetyltransferase
VILRTAVPGDAAMLTGLAVRSKRAWGYDEAFMQRVMPDMIVQPEYLSVEHGIVAEDMGTPVGYAIVRIDADRAFLRDLFIEPSHFRQGIGEKLFKEAVRYARGKGARTVVLGGDPHAVGFYKRMGMRQVGSEPSVAGAGRMLPIMSMEI